MSAAKLGTFFFTVLLGEWQVTLVTRPPPLNAPMGWFLEKTLRKVWSNYSILLRLCCLKNETKPINVNVTTRKVFVRNEKESESTTLTKFAHMVSHEQLKCINFVPYRTETMFHKTFQLLFKFTYIFMADVPII